MRRLDIPGYVAVITEGGAETAIIDILLDNEKLIFTRDDMLENKVIKCRDAQTFQKRYLRKSFAQTVTILRILDSRRENFKLSKAYTDKVKVCDIVTAPEIEMLIIHNEKKYDDFKKTRMKPSDYCKGVLCYKNVKNYDFVKDYFKDPDVLISVIKEYNKKAKVRKTEYTLFDLLKKYN